MWPFRKKVVEKEPAPPEAEPIVIAPGFAEYMALATSVEFLSDNLLREFIRSKLATLDILAFPYKATWNYLDRVAKLRGAKLESEWFRDSDKRAARAFSFASKDLAVASEIVPARALEIVQQLERAGLFPLVELKPAEGETPAQAVPFLVFWVSKITAGKGEQVFLAVTDVKQRAASIFVASWIYDGSLNYRGEGEKIHGV